MAERWYSKKALVWIGWNALLRLAWTSLRVWLQENKEVAIWPTALLYTLVRIVTMIALSAAVACLLQQEPCGAMAMFALLLRRAAFWSGTAAMCQIMLAGQLFSVSDHLWDMLLLCGSALCLPVTTISAVWRGGVLSGCVERKEILTSLYVNSYKNGTEEKN